MYLETGASCPIATLALLYDCCSVGRLLRFEAYYRSRRARAGVAAANATKPNASAPCQLSPSYLPS